LEASLHGQGVVRGLALSGDQRGGRGLVASGGGGALRGVGGDRDPAGAGVPHHRVRSARARGGDRRSHRIEVYRDVLLGAVKARVDITLAELSDLLWREHGARFAPSTVWLADAGVEALLRNSG
jgi:hypothetical protein